MTKSEKTPLTRSQKQDLAIVIGGGLLTVGALVTITVFYKKHVGVQELQYGEFLAKQHEVYKEALKIASEKGISVVIH